MTHQINALGQAVGISVGERQVPPLPSRQAIQGRFCRLEALDPDRHTASLFAANAHDVMGKNWTYLPYGPFDQVEKYRAWVEQYAIERDPLFFAIVDLAGQAIGVASYLRMMPNSGSIEVGHINYSPLLQQTPAATEAMYLMMARVFELGYRRYEWKCDALNAPSRAAAQRLGFSFEGIFRQATVVKGRNRDTAWYAIIDRDWPALQAAFQQWLAPANFDAQGQQRVRLSTLTKPLLNRQIAEVG